MRQLRELSEPFPPRYVHTNPSGGGSYVKHHVVTQRLLYVLGPHSFEMVEIVRGDVAGIAPNPNGNSNRAKTGAPPLTGVVVAVIARLRVVIDGRPVTVEEAGDCEEPHNWSTDGQRLKDAMSDAYKRCAMRLGCGLHLWSQDEYFLDTLLKAQDSTGGSARTQTSEEPAHGQHPVEADAAPAIGRVSGEASSEAGAVQPQESEGDRGDSGAPILSATPSDVPPLANENDFLLPGSGRHAGKPVSALARANPAYLRSYLPSLTEEQRGIAQGWLDFHGKAGAA